MRPAPPQSVVSDAPDGTGEFAIGQAGEWIRSADNKASVLLTGLTLVLAVVSSQARDLRALWTHDASRPAATWVLGAATLWLVIAYVLAVSVLVPRTSSVRSRYAWPWVATASADELLALRPGDAPAEAWIQAKALAVIAQIKFGRFKLAVWATAVSVALLIAWGILRP